MSGRSRPKGRSNAVVYVRISAKPAEGSVREQVRIVREFARQRKLRIVSVYREGDEGGSTRGRPVVG